MYRCNGAGMAEEKVSITPPGRPSLARASAQRAENWVQDKAGEPVERLTIKLPARLHAQVKAACALRGIKMKDLVRTLLEQECAAAPESPS